MGDMIRVEGLTEFIRSIDRAQADLPKAVRMAALEVAELVAGDARPGLRKMTRAALSSLDIVESTQSAASINAVGTRVADFGWSRGFYITRIVAGDAPRFEEIQTKALLTVVKAAGLDVD